MSGSQRQPGDVVWALAALLVVSGASALIFEVIWIRSLTLWFGRTVPAISTVLAAFMAGLALGGVVIGRVADRRPEPVKLYGILEVLIGATGLAVTMLFLHGGTLLAAVSRLIQGAGPTGEPLLRFLLFFAVLMVPSTLMGATVPVVSRALVRRGIEGRRLGLVYAANTTGAVLGALLPDLLLIPALGLSATASTAALGNFVVGVVVLRLMRGVDGEALDPAPPVSLRTIRPALALFAVSGFCAMGFEVVWSRILEHSTGLVTSFSVMLAVYLAALAVGSWAAAPLADRVRRPLTWAAVMLIAAGLSAIGAVTWLETGLRLAERAAVEDPGLLRQPMGVTVARGAWVSLFLQLAPCLLMGAAFPFLSAFAVRVGSAGRVTGLLLATNTLAGVLGSLATGFLLIPWLGSQASMQVLVCLAGAGGLAVLLSTRPGRGPVFVGLGAAAALALLVARMPADHLLGLFFPMRQAGTTLELVEEGPATTVAVVTHRAHGEVVSRELKTPGVTMSSTAFGARRYMGLMAHVPLLLSQERADALLICFGVGNTARSLLAHPSLDNLHVVDISPQVLDASPWFAELGGSDPLQDPRTTAFVDDGRHHLVVTDHRYDVITLEPPPPIHAGVVNLYTLEYYEAARRVLKPGGVVAQWVPVIQLSEPETAGIVASFVAAFPHTAMFYGYHDHFFLVGSDRPLRIDLDDWQKAIGAPGVRRDLDLIGVEGVEDLVATFMQSDSGLRRAVADAPMLTDDQPFLQYPALGFPAPPPLPAGLIGSAGDVLALVEGDPDAAVQRLGPALARHDALYSAIDDLYLVPEEIYLLVFGGRIFPGARWGPGRMGFLALLDVHDEAVEAARRRLQHAPDDAEARYVVGARAFYDGRWRDAFDALAAVEEAALPAELRPTRHLLMGGAARALGELDAAQASLQAAAATSEAEPFRRNMQRLIAVLDQPWGAGGPLSLPSGG